jgi:hypothetical protein
MPARVAVELDIFSGMPNPTWVLTAGQADHFTQQLAAKTRTSPWELSGNLGYRGFIVQQAQGDQMQTIYIQAGVIQVATGERKEYLQDANRELERWLLSTGKSHLAPDLFQIVEREIP